MSDWLLLGLLAVGFYLYECCTWTPATAFACYRRPFRRTWAAASGAELVGNESGGFAFGDPLTFSGNIIHCSHWPIAVSPDGVCLDSADAAQFWSFESIRTVSRNEKQVLFNGEVVFRAASESLALELVRLVYGLKSVPPHRRAEAVRAAIGQSCDAYALRSEWQGFLKSSRALTVLAVFPLAWLAVIAPTAMVVFGPLSTWPYLVGGLFLTGLAVTAEFLRVHRNQLPSVSDRWLHAASMTLFPIAAIRAADRISKERLAWFSPFTVVGVFCTEADGDPILRRTGFDLERASSSSTDAQIASCREWYYVHKRAVFRGLLKSLGRDPFAQPARIDPAMIVYCPRCHGQYADGAVACSDCDDVKLVQWSSSEARTPSKPRKRKRA